ncbi:MAG: replication initiation protein [Alphaproteobacteria bacterium]|nr:replication initiation protein [Alphaproteobacteria bacterium]
MSVPSKGKNFQTYSYFLSFIGRTCIHSKIREAILDSYKALEIIQPEMTFIYGEMGWCNGGRFRPHRTHQNGLSVDFMVPIRYKKTGLPAVIPTNIFTSFGYSMRFDETGNYISCLPSFRSSKRRCTEYQIDFKAIIDHLYALQKSALKQGSAIDKIIIDPPLLKLLRKEKDYFKVESLPFLQGKAWFSHDGHYHVDFKMTA